MTLLLNRNLVFSENHIKNPLSFYFQLNRSLYRRNCLKIKEKNIRWSSLLGRVMLERMHFSCKEGIINDFIFLFYKNKLLINYFLSCISTTNFLTGRFLPGGSFPSSHFFGGIFTRSPFSRSEEGFFREHFSGGKYFRTLGCLYIVCINPLQPGIAYLYSLKNSENL